MENNSRDKISFCLNKSFRFMALLLVVVIAAWICKSIGFSVYRIPSLSMYPALEPNEYVLVSKYPFNLRTPEYYPLTGIPFPYFFASGFGKVQREDIMVFDLPLFPAELHPARKEDYIKRCLGLPGDTVLWYEDHYYLKKDVISNKNEIIKSQLLKDSATISFVIPKKGAFIQLADSTQHIWESIVIRDGNTFGRDNSGIFLINGIQKLKYRAQQDYYFVQGDNRRFSTDSRSWGLVPKSNLIGRAEVVLWPWPPRWL